MQPFRFVFVFRLLFESANCGRQWRSTQTEVHVTADGADGKKNPSQRVYHHQEVLRSDGGESLGVNCWMKSGWCENEPLVHACLKCFKVALKYLCPVVPWSYGGLRGHSSRASFLRHVWKVCGVGCFCIISIIHKYCIHLLVHWVDCNPHDIVLAALMILIVSLRCTFTEYVELTGVGFFPDFIPDMN